MIAVVVTFAVGFLVGWAPGALQQWRNRRAARRCIERFGQVMKTLLAGPPPPPIAADKACSRCGVVNTRKLPDADAVGWHCLDGCSAPAPAPAPPFIPWDRAAAPALEAKNREPGRSDPEEPPLNPAWVAAGKPRD